MNSEELEVSLRTEFESYLKDVLAGMRQEANEFQSKIEAEFEKHKSQFDEAFRAFAERFDSTHEFDQAFTSSVAEHLRLARDEGARITATAMAEAEKLDEQSREEAPEQAAPSYDLIRDAVNEISSKDTQSAILKSLVDNAGKFAPRGAFFIIKSDHFVGWKVFGDHVETAENAVREIHFPTSSESILGAAVHSLSTVEGSPADHAANDLILSPLDLGEPDKMYAIPLMARGRAVAALYADQGYGGGSKLNREALETIVRVAGLTVELLAASQTAPAEARTAVSTELDESVQQASIQTEESDRSFEQEHAYANPEPSVATVDEEAIPVEPIEDVPVEAEVEYETEPAEMSTAVEDERSGFAFSDKSSSEQDHQQETEYEEYVSGDEGSPFDSPEAAQEPGPYEHDRYNSQPFVSEVEEETETEAVPVAAYAYDSEISADAAVSNKFEHATESFEPARVVSGGGYGQVAEQVVEAPAVKAAPYARLRDRPVDLPIEVPEEERRIHNDARRFARLLVSEIKLYNEKKVVEGRESQDLYERLREAIDRSREMYDKRVQPPVAAKFDYFHYEIVNSLADGQAERLGAGYPGASV